MCYQVKLFDELSFWFVAVSLILSINLDKELFIVMWRKVIGKKDIQKLEGTAVRALVGQGGFHGIALPYQFTSQVLCESFKFFICYPKVVKIKVFGKALV